MILLMSGSAGTTVGFTQYGLAEHGDDGCRCCLLGYQVHLFQPEAFADGSRIKTPIGLPNFLPIYRAQYIQCRCCNGAELYFLPKAAIQRWAREASFRGLWWYPLPERLWNRIGNRQQSGRLCHEPGSYRRPGCELYKACSHEAYFISAGMLGELAELYYLNPASSWYLYSLTNLPAYESRRYSRQKAISFIRHRFHHRTKPLSDGRKISAPCWYWKAVKLTGILSERDYAGKWC